MAIRSSGDDFRYQYYLAQAIKVEGVVRGWSLRELAARANMDYQSLLRKVNLARHFMLPEIEQVSAALGLHPSALLRAGEDRRERDPHSEGHDRIETDPSLSRKMRNEQHALLEQVTTPTGDARANERRLG